MGKRDIEVLREQLYHLIKGGYSYNEIYKVSTALDQLIISFYNKQIENNSIKA
ncbi:aspartyl-phosphate phosphatase Spo0E family protein [Lutibacter sp. B2]|nr:aspartyl-phosphate phosphatase Spo0E family protein [Lutibacter sp. B2]